MFAIVCDTKKFEKKVKRPPVEERKVEEEEDTFDWSKVQAGPDNKKGTSEEEEEQEVKVKPSKDDPEDPYRKEGPFAED